MNFLCFVPKLYLLYLTENRYIYIIMSITLSGEYKQRVEKLQQSIVSAEADACIITSSTNIYYLFGRIFDGYLYVVPGREPLAFARRPSGLEGDNVIYIHKPELIPDYLKERGMALPKRLMIESDVLSYNASLRLLAAMGNPQAVSVSGVMRVLRSIKSEYELDMMRECARIHASVYEQVPYIYKPGMTDIDFQIELEYLMRKNGSMGIFKTFGPNMDIHMGSILAGENAHSASPFDFALGGEGASPVLPLGANGTRLLPGTTLMVDMAGNYKPVMDDMTRSFAIEYAPDLAYMAHEVSIQILENIAGFAKAGVGAADLYFAAENIVKEKGLSDYFMGTTQQAKFIGHGVGLEINEPPVLAPRSREILQSGMTIAIEPKFVLPNIGAVGVENTYIVHEDGIEKITICDESLIVL